MTATDRARVALEVADDILGHGPLEAYLRDPAVSEIMVNGHDQIYVERSGRLYPVGRLVRRRGASAPHHREDRGAGRPAGRRIQPDGRCATTRWQPGQRRRAAGRAGRIAADDQEVRRRAPHDRPSHPVRHFDPAGSGLAAALRAGPHEHRGRRRGRLGQDHDAERAVGLHPGGRADRHDRGCRGTATAPGPRAPARVAPGQPGEARRDHDPRPRPQRAADAARPDHRRRGARRRPPSTCCRP